MFALWCEQPVRHDTRNAPLKAQVLAHHGRLRCIVCIRTRRGASCQILAWLQVIHILDGILLPDGETLDVGALPQGRLRALAVWSY